MIKEDVILWILLSDALLLSNREFYGGPANPGFICTCDMHPENSQDQSWLRSPSTFFRRLNLASTNSSRSISSPMFQGLE